jgi:small-conductance mechanosensitive channel
MNSTTWSVFVLLILLAVLFSSLLRRIGRMDGAHKVRRWLPLAYSLVWGGLLLGLAWTLATHDLGLRLGLVLVFLSLGAVTALGWLRSIWAGIVLNWEGRVREGQTLRVGEIQGEVVALGMRSIRIRDADGVVHEIPHHRFVDQTFSTYSPQGEVVCDLVYVIGRSAALEQDLETIREIALLTPLASPRHQPEVFLLDEERHDGRLPVQIRGYAFSADCREHYRSDVLARLDQVFRKPEIRA